MIKTILQARGGFRKYLSCLSFVFLALNIIQAQTHFSFTSTTGNDMTVAIPTSINPTINGEPMVNGDEIGAFTPGGLCVGAVVWNGSNLSITIWGDDDQTGAVDGIAANEQVEYKVWDQSANQEYDAVVAYSLGSGSYTPNGLAALSSLVASGVNGEAPSITSQPSDTTVLVGQTATFQVVAVGTNITYQWQKNGQDISGANTDTYTIPEATLADSGAQFHCIVSNNFGSDTSQSATLSVKQNLPVAPTILTPADASSVPIGEVTFSWEPLEGATTYNLQISLNTNFNNVDFEFNDLDSTAKILLLNNVDTYYWRVNAQNEGGVSPFSDIQMFMSVEPANVDQGSVLGNSPLKLHYSRSKLFSFVAPVSQNVQIWLYNPGTGSRYTVWDGDVSAGLNTFNNPIPQGKSGLYLYEIKSVDGAFLGKLLINEK